MVEDSSATYLMTWAMPEERFACTDRSEGSRQADTSQGVTIVKTEGTARGQTSDRRVRWVADHVLLSQTEAESVLVKLQHFGINKQ